MFKQMKIYYENIQKKRIEFSLDSPFKLFIDGIDGLSTNEISVGESSVVGQVGTSADSLQISSKTITFNGEITDDIGNNRKKMLHILYPGSKGKLIYANGDKEFYLDVIPKTTPRLSNHEDIQQFQFSVLAPYPYWRENSGGTIVRFGTYVSQYQYPQSFSNTIPWRISKKENATIRNVRNDSPVEIGFKIQFRCKGNVRNPYVVNIRTQEKISLDIPASLESTNGLIFEVKTVDNNKYVLATSSNGVSTSCLDHLTMDSTFFKLLSGDNHLRFGALENEEALEVIVTFDEILVGI